MLGLLDLVGTSLLDFFNLGLKSDLDCLAYILHGLTLTELLDLARTS